MLGAADTGDIAEVDAGDVADDTGGWAEKVIPVTAGPRVICPGM